MANPQTKLPAPAPVLPAVANVPAPAPAPAAGTLPPANVHAAPAKGKAVTLACVVGTTYGVACNVPNGAGAPGTTATVVLPYQVPAWVGKVGTPCTVTLASVAPNWLGTNGLPLLCTVYHGPAGAVVVQRAPGGGCKVNAYPAGMAGCGMAVVAL